MICRVGLREKMWDEVDPKVLKWFEHVECIIGEWLTKRVYNSGMEGRRAKDCFIRSG